MVSISARLLLLLHDSIGFELRIRCFDRKTRTRDEPAVAFAVAFAVADDDNESIDCCRSKFLEASRARA